MFKEHKDGQTHSYNDGCGEPEQYKNIYVNGKLLNPTEWRELKYCDKCIQMTNHKDSSCLKCSPQPAEWARIEKTYPEAYKLAREFHNLYEEFAPKFGYETRKETKEFDPTSPNGRLMAYVCYELVSQAKAEERERVVEMLAKIIDENDDGMWGCREVLDSIINSLKEE